MSFDEKVGSHSPASSPNSVRVRLQNRRPRFILPFNCVQICALKVGDFTRASVRPEEFRDMDVQARNYRTPEILLGARYYNQSGADLRLYQ